MCVCVCVSVCAYVLVRVCEFYTESTGQRRSRKDDLESNWLVRVSSGGLCVWCVCRRNLGVTKF